MPPFRGLKAKPPSKKVDYLLLNHRAFQRSHHAYLVGKTPAEALTGKPHAHWLELLGYQRFKKAV